MTKSQTKIIITKVHFYLLVCALLNFLLKKTIEISLNFQLAYFITILIYVSGMLLFIWNFWEFKRLTIYFSIYVITPIFALLFWLFGGIFLALLTSVLFYPVYPAEIKAENEKNRIYAKYQGFMGACCPYEITEKKFFFLEKKIAEINIHKIIDFEGFSINSGNGETRMKVRYNNYDYKTEKSTVTDTIIKVR